MLLYVFTVLLLLNAFTQDAVAQPVCADRVPGPVCKQMKDKGNCNNQVFDVIARMQCAKTCGFCQ
ncbi:shTK domain protein [Ancylostoma caninum]|uniref:ShTK domain protein n=1 Tax=Ancylostoma caninum TaxID=29170 RepID=A0A368HAE6_ANCCA|nr:shTK domain protein [Ancylostoma caninum]